MVDILNDDDCDDFRPEPKRFKLHRTPEVVLHKPGTQKRARSVAEFHCPEDGCDHSYNRKYNLQRHLADSHGRERCAAATGRFICQVETCGKAFFHASKLKEHYKEHRVEISTESKEFPSWEAFLCWKESEEEASHTFFVQPKGESMSSLQEPEFRSVLYTCCRDGKARENKYPRKTNQKRKTVKKSRKLEKSYCLARMHVRHHQPTGQVLVTYISTHTNHSLGLDECKYIPLSLSVRKEIQEKFAQGVTLERIMDDIRADLGQRHQRSMFDQKATRRHFITRQDCRNACRKVRDFTNHLHHNDAVSVDRIVKELQLEDPSPVIAYKPRGITNEKYPLLTEENFLLVLMTEFQATLFQKFSTLVCVDSTHKTNEYGYKLISIVVADEFRNGQPITWAIADTEDINTYGEVFKAVKAKVPDADVNTIMTDDDNTIIAACVQVYPGVTHILCRWHVDRAWQKKLHALVHDGGHKAEIYKYLWILMTEGDPEVFQENIAAFQTYWNEKEPRFISYFKDYYADRVDKWALCHRHFEHKDVDTNMLVESFHNKLKTNPRYLNHNVNRRCDDLIAVLMSVEVDMFYERKRKEVLTSITEASMKVEGNRHALGLKIMDLKVHVQEKENLYLEDSSDSKNQYTVDLLSPTCSQEPNCMPHCLEKECSYLCRHMVSCTCYDFQHGHLCKHSHKVHHLYRCQQPARDEIPPVLDDPDMLANSTEDEPSIQIGVQPLTSVQDEAAIQGKRNVIKTYVQEIQESVDKVVDEGVLDHTLAKLLPVLTTVHAHLNSQQEQPAQKPADFDVTDKFAPAQKNETQLRFNKVKPKANKTKFPLKHPSKEEQNVLHQILKQEKDMLREPSSISGQPKGAKRKRCGTCSGCTSDDCGTCQFCRDKPKFGGPGRKKKCCERRRCLNLTIDENTVPSLKCVTVTNQPERDMDTFGLTVDGTKAGPLITPQTCSDNSQMGNTKPVLKDVTNHLGSIVNSFRHTIDRTKANPLNFSVIPLQAQSSSQQTCLAKAIWQMKVAIALEVPTEGKLCLNPPITQTASHYIMTQVLPLLHSQGRTVDAMLPDGNCMFRALSKALFAVQSGHIKLRNLLVSFIESNSSILGGLCNGTVQSHCSSMRKATTFGTQAELQAAASLFQVIIYVFDKPSEERGWQWMWYKPYSREKLNYSNTNLPMPPDAFHIEILHDEVGCHFDLIVPKCVEKSLPPPQLPGLHTTLSIDLS